MKKVTLLVIGVMFTSTTVFADAPRKSTWNPTVAKNYALQYALNPNANYVLFSNDCTSFISQIMRAGGWKDTVTKESNQDTRVAYHSNNENNGSMVSISARNSSAYFEAFHIS